MSTDKTDNDSMLRELGGCGLFQFMVAGLACLPYIVCSGTILFMVFGSFNPGWRCMDGAAANNGVRTKYVTDFWTASRDRSDFCHEFEACQHIQFNTEASTIVTEWTLVCDRAWAVPVIISVQMAGMMLGSVTNSYLGDMFGRKFMLYLSLFINALLNVVATFSDSWQMFAAVRFFLGITSAITCSLCLIYATEFVTSQWRTFIMRLPFCSVGCIGFFVCALLCRDWKRLHLMNAIVSFVIWLPCFGLPESLRWLTTNKKQTESFKVVAKIAKVNRVEAPCDGCTVRLLTTQQENSNTYVKTNSRKYPLPISFELCCIDLIYFTSSFGLSSFRGFMFYPVILVTFAAEVFLDVAICFIPNCYKRSPSRIKIITIQTILIVYMAVSDLYWYDLVGNGFLVVVRLNCVSHWHSIQLVLTGAHSPAVGFGARTLSFGAVVAPILAPSNEIYDSYISFFVMAAICLLCGVFVLLRPGTDGGNRKGTADYNSLKQNDDDDDDYDKDESDDSDSTKATHGQK